MQNVPGFFSKDEEHFERDLCQTVSLGFCGRHPYGLQPERIEEQEAEVQRHEERSQGIDAMLDEELQRTGADPQEIDEYFQTSTAVRERVTARQRAYVPDDGIARDPDEQVRSVVLLISPSTRNSAR